MDNFGISAISIHSLRVEGDKDATRGGSGLRYFNPLPPCGGRHECPCADVEPVFISIHSLRVEGDLTAAQRWWEWIISIHSLRVEGDGDTIKQTGAVGHFNPLPPCGGRHARRYDGRQRLLFQSTPSVWRETATLYACTKAMEDFNPLPPCGGRLTTPDRWRERNYFNPLPPCGGRQQNCTAFRLKLSRANAILTKKNTDVLFHVRKNTFFLIFLRKNRCESLTLFLCAWGSHPSVFLEQKRFLHIDGFLCTDMFHFRLILIP